MCIFSDPISFESDEVWILADCENADTTDAFRIAYCPEHNTFAAFPPEEFDVHGAFPVYPETKELLPGLRWATTTDVDAHPEAFVAH
jgi:hypothetical protein